MAQEISICGITRDLLPLYLDDMLSDDSKALVEEHLAECPECRKIHAELVKNTSHKKKCRQEAVLSPIHQLTKEIAIFTFGTLLAAVFLVVSIIGWDRIRSTWPMWAGFEVADESDLTVEKTEDGIILTASPRSRIRFLYYIYDIDGDAIDIYLSFGSEEQQYEDVANHGYWKKDVDWAFGPEGINNPDEGIYEWYIGTKTLDGKVGASSSLTNVRTLRFPAETRNIYYVPDLSVDMVDTFLHDQVIQWEAACDAPDQIPFVDGLYLYQTDTFDFSALENKIKLYP